MVCVCDVSSSVGDVALLNCTAVVNTSNESLSDKNPVSDSILRHAGTELQNELLKLKGNSSSARLDVPDQALVLDRLLF